MHVVAILALDGVIALDLAIPCGVFGMAGVGRTPYYETRVCTVPGGVATSAVFGAMRLESGWGLDQLADADTVVVPGSDRFLDEPPPEMLRALRAAAARGARIASICVGSFVLAAAGLLDGRRATTHWEHAAALADRYPQIEVDTSVLYVDDGAILTSAGVASGLDLCLHLVRRDHGAVVAARTSRRMVVPLQREAGHAQLVPHHEPGDGLSALYAVLGWLDAHLDRTLTVQDIARHACVSVRTLTRWFRIHLGTTPHQWLLHRRVNRARQFLEATDLPVDRVAQEAGFGSPTTMRTHFIRQLGVSPRAYRSTFTAATDAAGHPG
ncbi:GlxA family transcriptional regulator [Streptomyces sp. 184]|uniref:GlxA family transcriptional regulator n=1 Tax=Streptomyces sp. 184 TaxID=1827526 RepID=UPI00389268BB